MPHSVLLLFCFQTYSFLFSRFILCILGVFSVNRFIININGEINTYFKFCDDKQVRIVAFYKEMSVYGIYYKINVQIHPMNIR